MQPEGQRTVQWPYICARAREGTNRDSAVHRINGVQCRDTRVIQYRFRRKAQSLPATVMQLTSQFDSVYCTDTIQYTNVCESVTGIVVQDPDDSQN